MKVEISQRKKKQEKNEHMKTKKDVTKKRKKVSYNEIKEEIKKKKKNSRQLYKICGMKQKQF